MILHIDMDAFYASIEQRDHPELVGKPVAVGGSPKGRGVISAASYEARRFGIRSAMPSAAAIRLCPDLIFVNSRIDHYATVSTQIREIFDRYTSLVEPLALDEAFLDVSGSTRLFGAGAEIARKIKSDILGELSLVASAGVAPNKYLAKLASDLEKPDGLVIVDVQNIQAFLDPLDISRIWGIGKQGIKKFHSIGIRTIGNLRQLPIETLTARFGINGEHFWNLARGIDLRQVVPDRVAKSISHERTFGDDISDREIIFAWLLELSDQVGRRLRRHEIRGKTLQLKLRYSDFKTITRSQTVGELTNSSQLIAETVTMMAEKILQPVHRPVRLVGVGVASLSRDQWQQKDLFDQDNRDKQQQLDKTRDEILDRFGRTAVRPATNIQHDISHRIDPRPEDEA